MAGVKMSKQIFLEIRRYSFLILRAGRLNDTHIAVCINTYNTLNNYCSKVSPTPPTLVETRTYEYNEHDIRLLVGSRSEHSNSSYAVFCKELIII